MRKPFIIAAFFGLAGAACQVPKYEAPKSTYTPPDFSSIMARLRPNVGGQPFVNPDAEDGRNLVACDRTEDAQPQIVADVVVDREIELRVQRQMVRNVCDGTPPGEEAPATVNIPRGLVQEIEGGLGGVSFASVRNERTCMQNRLDASDAYAGLTAEQGRSMPAGEGYPFPFPPFGALSKDGRLHLTAEIGSTNVLGTGVPVVVGQNSIVIKYYGACTRDRASRRAGERDSVGCADAPLLKTVHVRLNVRTAVEELSGVRLRRSCPGRTR